MPSAKSVIVLPSFYLANKSFLTTHYCGKDRYAIPHHKPPQFAILKQPTFLYALPLYINAIPSVCLPVVQSTIKQCAFDCSRSPKKHQARNKSGPDYCNVSLTDYLLTVTCSTFVRSPLVTLIRYMPLLTALSSTIRSSMLPLCDRTVFR